MNSGIHNTRFISIHNGQHTYEFELIKNIIMHTTQKSTTASGIYRN